MSLQNCLAKFGHKFPEAERAQLLAAVNANIAAGMARDAAELAAVESALTEAQTDHQEIIDAVVAELPALGRTIDNPAPVVDKPAAEVSKDVGPSAADIAAKAAQQAAEAAQSAAESVKQIADTLQAASAQTESATPAATGTIAPSQEDAGKPEVADIQNQEAMFARAPKSAEFRKWFGGSKVVDADGNPLVVYHGTATDFDEFEHPKRRPDLGFHFGDQRQADAFTAEQGARVLPVFLNIRNPLRMRDVFGRGFKAVNGVAHELHRLKILDTNGYMRLARTKPLGRAMKEARKIMEAAGYDGVVYENAFEGLRKLGENETVELTTTENEYFNKGAGPEKRYLATSPSGGTVGMGPTPEAARTDAIEFLRSGEHMPSDSWIAFRPEQIKSAIGNSGQFDANNANILMSKSDKAMQGGGLSVADAKAEVLSELGRTKTSKIKFAATWADLPQNLSQQVFSKSAFDVQGMFDPETGDIWIVTGNIRKGEAFSVVMHEGGVHLGLEGLVGKQGVKRLADQIRNWARTGGSMEHVELARGAVARIPADTPIAQRDEETIAYFVQDAVAAGHGIPKPDDRGPIARWFRELWQAVRSAIAKLGLNPDKLTTDDIVALARGALERSLGARAGDGTGRGGVAFARSGSRASWNAPEPTKLDNVIYAMQDKQIDTKRVLENIRKVATVDDATDVRLQEELYHGRTTKQVDDFLSGELKPLLDEMVARKVTMAEFEEYLQARHAEERNVQIAKINPDLPDGGSGMDTQDARDYLSKLPAPKKAAYESLAKHVGAINAATRQMLVDYGLESQETIDAWAAAYKNYVPLYREDMEGGQGTGQGFSVRGPASKRAMGSKRNVVDILANIAAQREKSIVRGEKNRVANALVGLAKANPNPDFWKVDEPPKIKYVDDRTGLVTEAIDPLYHSRDNVVMARMPNSDGKILERSVIFNEHDERAMRMAQALKNLDMDELGVVLGMSAKATRYFAAVNTQYNPVFGAVNITRDTLGAMANLSTTELAGKQAEVLKNVWPALSGIYKDLRDIRKGKLPTSAWSKLYEEFANVGGKTGYRDMFRTSKDRGDAIAREIAKATEGTARHAGRAVFDWLSDYNDAMENAVRLAAYKVGKESGMTNERAASLAKNLTVNFNRKGQVATQAGALYAFFNASVQGTARLAETLSGPAGQKIIAGGLALGAVQALVLSAAGFDDDEPPDFVRERNVIIPTGDKTYITIPMPLGLHIIPNISRVAMEYAMSGFKDPGKRVTSLVGVFADAMNPIGNAGLSLQTIAPTVIDPIAALAENKDFTGKPISREQDAMNPKPGFQRAKDTATALSKAVSQGLNLLSGGTNYKPGIFSPTPDQIDYLVGQVTGGVGREISKVEQYAASKVTGEELPTYKTPLLGRFYGSADDVSSQANKFYTNLKMLAEHEAEIKGRIKARESVSDYIQENPEARLYKQADHFAREVNRLRKAKRELIDKDAGTDAVKSIDNQINARMQRLNDIVKQARA